MKNQITLLILVLFILPFSAQATMEGDTSSHQLLLIFEEHTPQDSILEILEEMDAEEIWEIDDVDMALWEVKAFPVVMNDGEEIFDINAMIRRMRARTRIRSAEFNFETKIGDDEQGSSQMGCFDPAVFQVPTGNKSVKISILDTGISDMTDNTTSDYNYNLTEYSGYDYIDDDETPNDLNGHGTHMAGIIHSIAKYNPNLDISFDIRKTHGSNGKAYLADILLAMYEAIEDDADILNLSFSAEQEFDPSQSYPLQRMIEEAEDEDVLVVVAAGNSGTDNDDFSKTSLPASFTDSNILAVASYDCDNTLAAFSNYGAQTVDVATYGVDIPGPDLGDGISYLSGTSQSTAIVTAVAALMATNDIEEPEDIKCELTEQNVPIYALNGTVVGCEGSTTRSAVHQKESEVQTIYPTVLNGDDLNVVSNNIDFIQIFDANGNEIFAQKIKQLDRVVISTQDWNVGMYFVRLNYSIIKKVVVVD